MQGVNQRATPMDHLAKEAVSNTDDEPVAVLLEGQTVMVRPVREWRTSSVRAMREGDLDKWAEGALVDGDYAIWQAVDPTIGQCEVFFTNYNEASSTDLGESSASSR